MVKFKMNFRNFLVKKFNLNIHQYQKVDRILSLFDQGNLYLVLIIATNIYGVYIDFYDYINGFIVFIIFFTILDVIVNKEFDLSKSLFVTLLITGFLGAIMFILNVANQ
jgi:hypothetical protein